MIDRVFFRSTRRSVLHGLPIAAVALMALAGSVCITNVTDGRFQVNE